MWDHVPTTLHHSLPQKHSVRHNVQQIYNKVMAKVYSHLNNIPGPCGAAAVIYIEGMGSQPVILKRPFAPRTTSYLTYIAGWDSNSGDTGTWDGSPSTSYHPAIHLSLGYISYFLRTYPTDYNIVAIHTDCVSALQTVRSPNTNNPYALNESIRHHVTSLTDHNNQLEIAWIAGHADVSPNELADMHRRRLPKQLPYG